ncbi:hypothetical protein [Agromyces seonyuensis]|uniref:Uncharacterized protein n=1 Tax=Agromyces seonyuensis TaxID=2662446 RepID=A0A6I4P5E2_9MICO|nr:hypothetical protein [Agromyces seonyuensis]MWB98644.1 hypothetical protein [Agromyces seonyuensis]
MSHSAPHVVASKLGLTNPAVAGLLALLLLADAALILLYWSLEVVGEPSNPSFDLQLDRGYGEFFQYVQSFWAAALLTWLAVRERVAVLGAWALVCVFFLTDDWFQLHEHAGFWFAGLVPSLGDVGHDLGEIVWFAAVGLVLVIAVWLTDRVAPLEWRSVSAVLIVLFGLLIFAGIVVDAVHETILDLPGFGVPLVTLEDGGEIVVMSFIVTFLFAVATTRHRPTVGGPLHRLVGTRPQDGRRPGKVAAG